MGEDDVKSSPLFIEASSKLEVAERDNQKLKDELQSIMDRWAVTKGDLEQSRKSVDDLEEKHKKRMKELYGGKEGSNNMEEMEIAKRVVQLEHKLKHALDSVRQAEALKTSLIDANTMNDMLQRKIYELKAANDQFEAEKEKSNQEILSSIDENMSNDKILKMKKELSAAMQSKDHAKLKLEVRICRLFALTLENHHLLYLKYSFHRLQRSEKERESLLAINGRLQQQMMDKEDMNAKSLSTILHLRQLSEELEQEKSIREKKLKSAEQLAVMVRLASNAKEKVEREAMREKEAAEEEVKKLKQNIEEVVKQNDDIQGELSQAKSLVQKGRGDLEILKERCDDLVSSSTASEKQIKQLSEDFVIAKKDAIEAIQKANIATASSSGAQDKFNSEFTAEQLTIQVNELKHRIACPICNTRDKRVIITRCRHMFCRHCVALNLESRNRKCPSCNIRFDKKDVEDVWF